MKQTIRAEVRDYIGALRMVWRGVYDEYEHSNTTRQESRSMITAKS